MRSIKFWLLVIILPFCISIARAQVDVKVWNHYDDSNLQEILLEFNIQDGWHIFAPYKQEFGTPLEANWKLPQSSQLLEESFSKPRRFEISGFVYDGYENKAFYKTTIRNTDRPNLKVELKWQACADEECLPQSTSLTILSQESSDFLQKLKKNEYLFAKNANNSDTNIIIAILMALTAGIILNLMPCVLPVLGLKILACLKADKKERRSEAIFYTCGVVCSMLLLASILFWLKEQYPHLSWGFQMQSPWFVGIMLAVFIVLTLLSFEIINLHTGKLSKLSNIKFKNCQTEAFASGILAVLIASPCTAPFMGAAVGYALMSPSYIYFPIFLSLGIGYALPFALATAFPVFSQKIMPHPGKWMRTIKMILGIPLLLTCLWLGGLLCSQLGLKLDSHYLKWQEYTQAKVEQAIKDKQPIFIDFTADWCITCLVNKKTSLNSNEMAELVKNKNILLLKADITTVNYEAAKGLKKYQRAGIPLYIYYDGRSDDYLILPQILTPSILQEYLK